MKSTKEAHEKLTAELKSSKEAHESTQKELKQAKEAASASSSASTGSSAAHEKLAAELKSTKEAHEKLTAELKSSKEAHESTQKELKQAKEAASASSSASTGSSAAHEKLAAELKSTKAKLLETEKERSVLTAELKSAKQDLHSTTNKAMTEKVAMSGTIATLSGSLAAVDGPEETVILKKTIAQLTEELKVTKNTLTAFEKKSADDYTELQMAKRAWREVKTETNADINHKSTALTTTSNQLKFAQDQLEDSKHTVLEHASAITKLTADLEQAHKKIEENDNLLFTMLEKCKSMEAKLHLAQIEIKEKADASEKVQQDIQFEAHHSSQIRDIYEEKEHQLLKSLNEKEEQYDKLITENQNLQLLDTKRQTELALSKNEIEDLTQSRLAASVYSETLLSEKNILESKLKLRNEIARDLNQTIRQLQDLHNSGWGLPTEIPKGCVCAQFKPQLFSFITLAVATEAALHGREVDENDERVQAALRARKIRYAESSTAEQFHNAEKKSLLLLLSTLEEVIVSISAGLHRKVIAEKKSEAEKKLKDVWIEDLMHALSSSQDELAAYKLQGLTHTQFLDRINLERSRVRAARVESKQMQTVLNKEVNTLRNYVIDAQEHLAELTGNNRRPALISRASRILSKLKPWVGMQIQKSVFESHSQTGVTIVNITPGGPAAEAGLSVDMVVECINDEETRFNAQFFHAFTALQPGDRANFQVLDTTNQVRNIFMEIRSMELNFKLIHELKRISAGIVQHDDEELLDDIQWNTDHFASRNANIIQQQQQSRSPSRALRSPPRESQQRKLGSPRDRLGSPRLTQQRNLGSPRLGSPRPSQQRKLSPKIYERPNNVPTRRTKKSKKKTSRR